MVDVAYPASGAMTETEQVDRARILNRLRLSDVSFRYLTRAAAIG